MKAQYIILAISVLLSLPAGSCRERGDTGEQADAGKSELNESTDALQSEQEMAPPVSTAREAPGSQAAASVTARSLLDQVSANQDLRTFASLLRSANMVKNLSSTGPYTLFAPTEKAFEMLPDNTLANLRKPDNRERLQEMLNNHIIAGKLTTHDLQDGAILKTTAGHQLKVSKRDGQVRINGALVEKPDEMSSNGVLHVVDKVLLPSEEE